MALSRRKFLTGLTTQKPVKDYPLTVDINPYANSKLPYHLELTTQSVNTYQGNWTRKEAAHLLRRTLFGYNESQLNQAVNLGMEDTVNLLLDANYSLPSPPVNNYNSAGNIDPNIPYEQTWVNDTTNPQGFEFHRILSFKSWAVGLMMNQDFHISEKLTLFWQHHFATELDFYNEARFAYKQNNLLRSNCLGDFKQLVKHITLDPAMLVYLNGYRNTKTAPDENYARELFELFTLGKGDDSQYNESDVQNAAKILTGWRINPININSFFDPSQHDTGNKTFSAFFNNTTILGKTAAAGADETDELISMIFNKQQVVARFICRKLYRYFCYYVIDEQIENNVIIPLANTFITNNWEIKPVLNQLLKSEHFYAMNSIACQIKNPFDYTFGILKAFDAVQPTETDKKYTYWLLLNQFSAVQGMNYADPPSVSGWPAYYQEPQYHQIWINSDTIAKRKQVADGLIYFTGINIQGVKIYVDIIEYTDKLSDPSNPNLVVEEALEHLLTFEVSSAKKAELKSILLSGQQQDFYWTAAWNSYKANPTDQTLYLTVYIRLFTLYQHILTLPEYQLI
jgi:uncharacterized protein (DUF1800 family)